MDLITALRSNRRFRRVADEQGKQDPTWQVNPAPSPNSPVWSDNDLLADYELEPEPPKPIVFEGVRWIKEDGNITVSNVGVQRCLEQFVGKRTKVTIEIID